MKKVLFLGATGRIGESLLEELEKYEKDYEIIIGVHKTPSTFPNQIKINLSDIEQLKEAMKDFEIVVNLAANSNKEASFQEILEPNIVGAYNVFEAARQTNCERVIFASSVHTVKGYPLGSEIKHSDATKPINFYGASKVFGESLCNIYASKYNLSCLAIRIGAYISNSEKEKAREEKTNLDYAISQKDLAQLIHKCITAPETIKFAIFGGSSNNKQKFLDISYAKELIGYEPVDDFFEK